MPTKLSSWIWERIPNDEKDEIDVQKGILTMTVFNTTVGLRIFDAMRSPLHLGDCFWIDIFDTLVETSLIKTSFNELLEASIAHNDMKIYDERIRATTCTLLYIVDHRVC